MAAVIPTILVIVLAIPPAFALAIRQVPKWRDVMFVFLSTKMMPTVAGLLPMTYPGVHGAGLSGWLP